MVRKGFRGVVAYIDDFFIAAPTYSECEYWMSVLMQLIRKLGFCISYKKVVGPAQQITFLGIQIDTVNGTLTLGEDKITRLQQQLGDFRHKTRATKQQLQSLAGSLNYACQAIRGGRFFLRRILDAMQPLKQQRHKARLSSDFQKDIQWWLSFLSVFNGVVYYSDSAKEHVSVDACNKGAGTFWQGKWNYVVFERDQRAASTLHINYKEICAVVHAVDKWSHLWEGKTVVVHTDSLVAKGILNKGWCKDSYVNRLLRKMAFKCARQDISLQAVHVPGSLNIMADTISRLHERGKACLLLQLLSHWHHGSVPFSKISDHMSNQAALFLFDRCSKPG
jgi:hypothetical protein